MVFVPVNCPRGEAAGGESCHAQVKVLVKTPGRKRQVIGVNAYAGHKTHRGRGRGRDVGRK